MDTDDLSKQTYKGVILEAEKFNHDLTLQFGVLASHCKNEIEYLENAKNLINEIKELDKFDLSYMFFGSPPVVKDLYVVLDKILKNITEIEKIPVNNRHYEF